MYVYEVLYVNIHTYVRVHLKKLYLSVQIRFFRTMCMFVCICRCICTCSMYMCTCDCICVYMHACIISVSVYVCICEIHEAALLSENACRQV